MSITQRVLLLIVLSLLTQLSIGTYGIWEQQQAKHRFEATLDNLIPSTRALNAANAAFLDMRGNATRHLISSTPEQKREAEALVAAADQRLDQALELYEKHNLSNNRDRELLQNDLRTLAAYREQRKKLFEYSNANNLVAAHQFFTSGEMNRTSTAFRLALNEHAEFNFHLSEEIRQENQSAFNTALLSSSLVVLASIALLLFIGGQVFRTIKQGLASIQHTLQQVSSTLNFTLRAPVKRLDEIGLTATAFNELLVRLQDNLRSLRLESEQVASAAQALNQTAGQVATAASSQSLSSANVAATVEEMTVSVNHVSYRAAETHQLASSAGQMAHSGSTTISQTIADIHQISRSVDDAAGSIRELDKFSSQVTAVVGVIQEIADQTNLLALNASIEAARAGEMGRGFAVVADEVRMLAERTTKSTKEISETLSAMHERSRLATSQMQAAETLVRNSVGRADDADQAIKQISESTGNTVTMVSEISCAIKEQGSATNSIAAQIESIAQMSEQSSAAAQETSHNAARLDQLAQNQIATLAHYQL